MPGGRGYEVEQTGSLRDISTRDVHNHHIVFDLNIPAQSQQTIFLRFQSGASMTLPLTLWTVEAFALNAQLELLLHGLFFGALLALLAIWKLIYSPICTTCNRSIFRCLLCCYWDRSYYFPTHS